MLDAFPIPDPTAAPIAWGVVLVACVIGCVTDLRARRLPNAMTLPLWITGLVFAATTGGFPGLAGALAASVLLALPYIILFVIAGGGAGDAKMMAGIGAWLGLTHGLYALVVIALVGGAVGVVWSLCNGSAAVLALKLRTALTGAVGLAYGRLTPGECCAFMPPAGGSARIPYGLAIVLGALVAFGGGLQWHA
jgi:prepilin peptidase CpaA